MISHLKLYQEEGKALFRFNNGVDEYAVYLVDDNGHKYGFNISINATLMEFEEKLRNAYIDFNKHLDEHNHDECPVYRI